MIDDALTKYLAEVEEFRRQAIRTRRARQDAWRAAPPHEKLPPPPPELSAGSDTGQAVGSAISSAQENRLAELEGRVGHLERQVDAAVDASTREFRRMEVRIDTVGQNNVPFRLGCFGKGLLAFTVIPVLSALLTAGLALVQYLTGVPIFPGR